MTQLAESCRPEGQATFDMPNVRPDTTNLPFVVWVSQRDNYPHDVRVKVGYRPRAFPSQMGTYGVRPFQFIAGQRLAPADEPLLEQWIALNSDVILGFWNGDIEYTEDMLKQIRPLPDNR